MINVLIYSKNRPAQLELLLRSMKLHFFEWPIVRVKVLYKATTQSYESGYYRSILLHSEFQYIKEEPGQFKSQTLSLIDENLQATMFLVDDIVFKNDVCLRTPQIQNFLENKNIACVSLRMCPRINYCYTEKRDTPPPVMTSDGTWMWKGLFGDWAYPMSLDGHIFRTGDILPLLRDLSYTSPNTLEGELAQHPFNKPYMICYPESILFNIPANKVQTDNSNHCGNISAEALNRDFLDSKRISLINLENFKNTACHQEMTLIMEDHIIPLDKYANQKVDNNKSPIDFSHTVRDQNTVPTLEGAKDLVSICIPTYEMHGQGVSMLKQNIESILCQKYTSYEIIVSDHSENDDIEKYVSLIPQVRYFRCSEGRGVSSINLNNAIRQAKGKLIKPLFQDDFLLNENSLGNFVEGLGGAVWGAGDSVHYEGDGLTRLHTHKPSHTESENLLRGLNSIGCPSVVIFKNDNNFFDSSLIWLMDTEFYYRMLLKYGQFKQIHQASAGVRVWEKSVGKTLATEQVKEKEQFYVLEKSKKLVTFVVPSIGRDTLERTINSLQKQTVDSWQCIVVLDGVKCPDKASWREDSRITYLEVPKTGTSANRHGNGGRVRNVALAHVLTPFTAFVDDDDYLHPTYVESIIRDIGLSDGVVFRMSMPSGKIVPPLEMGNQIMQGHVGISYVLKTSIIKGNKISFINSNSEDFDFLDKARKAGASMHVSEKALYHVGANE